MDGEIVFIEISLILEILLNSGWIFNVNEIKMVIKYWVASSINNEPKTKITS